MHWVRFSPVLALVICQSVRSSNAGTSSPSGDDSNNSQFDQDSDEGSSSPTMAPDFKGRRMPRAVKETAQQLRGKVTKLNDYIKGKNTWEYLFRYGCYCFPQLASVVQPSFGYAGKPVDQLDELCMKLYRAQKCLVMDREDAGDSEICDVEAPYDFYVSRRGKKTVCSTKHDDCVIQNCELEAAFTDEVKKIIEDGYKRNPDYKWQSRSTDPEMKLAEEEAHYKNICHSNHDSATPDRGLSSALEIGSLGSGAGDLGFSLNSLVSAAGMLAEKEANGGNGGNGANGSKPKGVKKCCGEGLERHSFKTNEHSCCDGKVSDLGSCL